MIKSKLTPGENFLRAAHGEIPDFIPIHTMGFPGYNGETAWKIVGPSLFDETHITPAPEGRTDIWGVKYVSTRETNYASIPEPNHFMLEDVTRWHEVIRAPELPEHIDWEKLAKEDYKRADIDTRQSAAMSVIGLMPFQQFIAFMGFTNGLMAMYEEPEAVKELLHFMTDVYMPVVRAAVDHYHPDVVYLLDDTATNLNPFISPEMFRNILKPVYKRLTQPAVDRGIPVQFHNCGRCEDFIDDMIDFGTTVWDPAQQTNNLDAIKEKHGRRFAIAGGFWMPVREWSAYREDEVRQAVRACIDRYAPGGGYIFAGGVGGVGSDPVSTEVNRWVQDEAFHYGRDYYLK